VQGDMVRPAHKINSWNILSPPRMHSFQTFSCDLAFYCNIVFIVVSWEYSTHGRDEKCVRIHILVRKSEVQGILG